MRPFWDPRRWNRATRYAVVGLLQLVLAALLVHPWDGFVFETTVRSFVEHGTTPYALIDAPPDYVYSRADPESPAEWYAYPPLPLLLMAPFYWLQGVLGNPWAWAARLAWKLPWVAATLLLPWVARRTALALGASTGRAQRVETLLLVNPFLWAVGSAWGMTDTLLVLLFVASLWALARGRLATSGVLLGLAGSIKLFPWFLYPALLGWIALDRRNWRDAARHGAAALGTFAALALPFFVPHPRGFLQLVLWMHLDRPAQGMSLFRPLQALLHWTVGPHAALGTIRVLSLLQLALFLLLVLGWLAQARHSRDRLPWALGALWLVFVLSNKVLHWQYFVPPVVLLLVSTAFPHPWPARLDLFAHRARIWAAPALLFDEFRFLRWIPRDIATRLFGVDSDALRDAAARPLSSALRGIEASLGLYPPALVNPVTAAVTFLIMVFVVWPLVSPLFAFVRGAFSGLGRVPLPTHRLFPAQPARALATVLVGLLLALPGAFAVARHEEVRGPPLGPEPATPEALVGIYYYLWWRNPTYDPSLPDGNWRYATTQPLAGYYSSFNGRIEADVADLESSGFDFALVPVHAYDVAGLETLVGYAEQAHFHFAPLLDLAAAPQWSQRTPAPQSQLEPYPLLPSSLERLRSYVALLASDVLDSPALVADAAGHPLFFVEGVRWLGDATHPLERQRVAERVQDQQSPDLLTWAVGNESWSRNVHLLDPEASPSARDPALLRSFWAAAYQQLYQEAWRVILEPVLSVLPDAAFLLATSDVGQIGFPADRVKATYVPWDEARPGALASATARPPARVPTVWAAYDAHLLRPTDPVVLPARPLPTRFGEPDGTVPAAPMVLFHSWNDHLEGTALEPTREHGSDLIEAASRWIPSWRAAAVATVN